MATALARNGHTELAQVINGGAPSVISAMESLKAIRTFISNELKGGTDFGVIPGTNDKQVLMLPGAQKICMFLQVYPMYGVKPHELGEGHVEYVVSTRLIHRAHGDRVGTGIGSCSTMEKKYRYRSSRRVCPECGSTALVQTKTGRNPGGYWCIPDKGGCGGSFNPGDKAVTGQQLGQVENPDIADQRNTVLKMAKKRSFVDAAIGLACLADQFTQDMDDVYDLSATSTPRHDDDHDAPAPPPREAKPATRPRDKAQPPREPDRASVNEDFRPATRQAETGDNGSVPRSGRALFAWAKEQGNKHEIDLVKYLTSWGKLHDHASRITEWSNEQTQLGYAEGVRKLAAVFPSIPTREPEDQAEPPRPSRGKTDDQFGQLIDEALTAWHRFEPATTTADKTAREHRIVNALATYAVEDDLLKGNEIGEVNKDGKLVRVPAKAWNAVKLLFMQQRSWVEENVGSYLAEKENELTQLADDQAPTN